MTNEVIRSLVIGSGLAVYPFCVLICISGFVIFRNPMFFWQAVHLIALTCSTAFFTLWYNFGRPELPYNMQFHLPNVFNIFMIIGAFMWCWCANIKEIFKSYANALRAFVHFKISLTISFLRFWKKIITFSFDWAKNKVKGLI